MRYNYNKDIFTSENALSCYILGAFLTDGNITITPQYSASLTSKDIDWVESIRNIICKNKPLISDKIYKKLSITDRDIVKWFINYNCIPKKSFIVKFPSITEKYLPDLIRGIIDGDGHIGIYKNRIQCSITSASYTFIKSISDIFNEKKINHSLKTIKPKNRKYKNKKWISKEYYVISLFGSYVYSLLQWAYYPNHQISMSRKNNLAQKIFEYYKNKSNFLSRKLNVGCKIIWPSDNDLINMVIINGFLATAKKLSISDSAIRDRFKRRKIKINLPRGRKIKIELHQSV